MITLHKLNGSEIVVNAELIENMEPGRETVVALTNGNRYIVSESADVITQKVLEYRARLLAKVEALRPAGAKSS